MIAIYIALCAIFGVLVAIVVDIDKIARVVEKYGKDGDGDGQDDDKS